MSKRLLILMIILLLATACQSSKPNAPEPSTETTTEAAVESNTAATENQSETQPAEAADEAVETHSLTDAQGRDVEIPINPQRVVTLTELDLDSALAVGITPVGSVNGRGQQTLPAYLADLTAEVESVGSLAEPSLEKIVSLNPDLILVGDPIPPIQELMPELEQIAPVFVTFQSGENWQETFTWKIAFEGVAVALNREAEAEVFLADYQQRVETIKALLPADGPIEASVTRWMPEGPVVMVPAHFSSLILADVGLSRPAAHADIGGAHGAHSEVISMEALDIIDGDWLFIGTLNADGTAALDAVRDNLLFQQLEAVQNNQVVTVDGTVWTSIGGPLAALKVLDDIEQALRNAKSVSSNNGADSAFQNTADVAAENSTAFPVTIKHKYGSTEITKRPERIVTVGLTEQDALLALGIVPVGTTEWFGEYPGAIWPWAQDRLDGTLPELVGDAQTINFEKIAALKPDVILALYAGLTEEQYDLLAQIAPTVAQPANYVDYGIPWQELTRTVGQVVGQAERADKLVAHVEARFEQVRAEHPEFVGATSVVATPYQGIWIYGPEDVRGRFLTDLGFELPPGLEEITGAEFGGNLSMERADLLDVDVIIWLDPEEAEGELGGPVYQSLPVHTEGREVFLDSYNDPLGGATSFVSVLSLPFLLDGLVPQLAEAIDGGN